MCGAYWIENNYVSADLYHFYTGHFHTDHFLCHKAEFGGLMIRIDKAEAEHLRKRFPDITITRTMKQRSKRHRYYVEESYKVLNALAAFRKSGVVQ